ncbi:MAG: hypothetical protein FWH34_08550, partial [Desulfovibrionaceae bacterium]|nr:hypothetical protein [Desulfovibrionaceae bacterium]
MGFKASPVNPGVHVEFSWKALPRKLALPLLKGSVGKTRLCAMAQRALEMSNAPGSPGLRLGADM